MPQSFLYRYDAEQDAVLDSLAAKLDAPEDYDLALRVLRYVFRSLRVSIPFEDSIQLLKSLPLFLKLVYIEAWDTRGNERKPFKLQKFLKKVCAEAGPMAAADLGTPTQTLNAVLYVFSLLNKYKKDFSSTFLPQFYQLTADLNLKNKNMSHDFQKFAQEAKDQLIMLSVDLGKPGDTAYATRVLKSVMHGLRDSIAPEESIQMLSQLPMFLKALYVDGWDIKKGRVKMKDLDDFMDRVKYYDGRAALNDFNEEYVTFSNIQVVLNFLKRYISYGEIQDMKATMPGELKSLWDGPIKAL